MAGRAPDTDVVRIIFKTADSQIYINGILVTTLATGSVFAPLSNGNQITSNNDIAVMQFARCSNLHGGNGGPMIIYILPSNLYSKKHLFNTLSSTYFSSHYITIYTRTIYTGLVKLDGAIMGGTWTAVGTSGWSYRTSTVSVSLHTLESDSLLCGIVYGWGGANSYSYFMGGSFLPILLAENGLRLYGWHSDEGSKFL